MEETIWALPFAVIWSVGYFVWPFALLAIDDANWFVLMLVRVVMQVGSALVLSLGTAIKMEDWGWRNVRNIVVSVPVGLALGLLPSFTWAYSTHNSLLDLMDGPLEGEILSVDVERTRGGRSGPLIFTTGHLRGRDGRDYDLSPYSGPLERAISGCASRGLPLGTVKVLRHSSVLLSHRCGKGSPSPGS